MNNFYKIEWETDGETVELPGYAAHDGDIDDLPDILSDEHGWLVSGLTLVPFDFEAFVDGYIECILWCDAIPVHADPAHEDYEDSWESGGLQHLSMGLVGRSEIIERAMLREFVADNLADLLLYCEVRAYDPSEGPVESYAGHDFYLTRAGHGAGFWDRGLGELGDRLTDASKSYGSVDDHMLFDNGEGEATL